MIKKEIKIILKKLKKNPIQNDRFSLFFSFFLLLLPIIGAEAHRTNSAWQLRNDFFLILRKLRKFENEQNKNSFLKKTKN